MGGRRRKGTERKKEKKDSWIANEPGEYRIEAKDDMK